MMSQIIIQYYNSDNTVLTLNGPALSIIAFPLTNSYCQLSAIKGPNLLDYKVQKTVEGISTRVHSILDVLETEKACAENRFRNQIFRR